MNTINLLFKGITLAILIIFCFICYQIVILPEASLAYTTPSPTNEKPPELPCKNFISQKQAKEVARNKILFFKENLANLISKDFDTPQEQKSLINETLELFENPEKNVIEIIASIQTQEIKTFKIKAYLEQYARKKNNNYSIDWEDKFEVPDFQKNKNGDYQTVVGITQIYKKYESNTGINFIKKLLYGDVTEKKINVLLITLDKDNCSIKLGNIKAIKAQAINKDFKN